MRNLKSALLSGASLFFFAVAVVLQLGAGSAMAGDETAEPTAKSAAPAKEPKAAGSEEVKPKPAETAGASGGSQVKPSEELDDFGRRAQEVLKAENAPDKLHPLQERYPDHNVVVCEGGCGGTKIIFKEKKDARKPADHSEMMTSAGTAGEASGAEDGPLNIVCAAGCYDSKKVLRGVDGRSAKSRSQGGSTADASKTKATASESGSWMSKINEDQGRTSKAAASQEAPKAADVAPVVAAAEKSASPAAEANAPVKGAVTAPAASTGTEPAKVTASEPASSDKPTSEGGTSVAPSQEQVVAAASTSTGAPAGAGEAPQDEQSSKEIPKPAEADAAGAPSPARESQQSAEPEKPVEIAQASGKNDKQPESKTINVPAEDPEMTAAIKKARDGLGEFWSKLEKPGEGESDFAIKVAISDKGQTEHFWLTNIERKDGNLAGTIANTPTLVKTVTQGQRYEFSEDKISDWLYKRNGKMVGNETMRPLLKRMPKEQADAYRSLYEKP